MSLFKAMMHLNELQVNGQTVDDNDDFNVGEDEDSTPTNAEAQNDTPSNTAQTNAEDNNTAEQTMDDNEDDFTLDDANESDTAETQSTDEPADDTTGEENTSDDTTQNDDASTTDDVDTTGEESGDDSDDDFTVDGSEDEGDSGDGDNSQSDTSDSNNSDKSPDDPSDSIQDDEDRAAEEAIYDSLTDDQKRIRVLQLKLNYKDLYETMNTTLDGIDNIPKNTDNIDTIKRLTMLLTKAKSILIDYVENNFDSNPYLENYTMYIKYMAVFRTAAKVIEELNASSKK